MSFEEGQRLGLLHIVRLEEGVVARAQARAQVQAG
jgi:hypothetical protein